MTIVMSVMATARHITLTGIDKNDGSRVLLVVAGLW